MQLSDHRGVGENSLLNGNGNICDVWNMQLLCTIFPFSREWCSSDGFREKMADCCAPCSLIKMHQADPSRPMSFSQTVSRPSRDRKLSVSSLTDTPPDIRDKSKREGHELNFSDMAKVVGEQWQMIPVQEREMYEQSAAAQKAEYITRLEEYKKTEQFREYEKYYANFKALHARDGSRDRPSDDEGMRFAVNCLALKF